MCTARASAARAASRRASLTVGWQCIVPTKLVERASSFIASAASSMMSVALSARMCTPSISPYLAPGYDLYHAVDRADDEALAVRAGGEAADLDLYAPLGALLLGEADAGEFGADIGAARARIGVEDGAAAHGVSQAAASPMAMAAWASMSLPVQSPTA